MTKRLAVFLVLVFFVSAAILVIPAYSAMQCGGHGSSSHSEHENQPANDSYWGGGRSVNAIEINSVSTLLNNKEKYLNKIIVLGGKISSECSSGHWFYVDDGKSNEKVYAETRGFALPQIIGSKIKVYGNFSYQNNKYLIEAKRVELSK